MDAGRSRWARRASYVFAGAVLVVAALALFRSLRVPGGHGPGPRPSARCAQELKKLSLAVLLYCDDHGDRLPAAHTSLDLTTGPLDDYIQTWELWYCVADPQWPSVRRAPPEKTRYLSHYWNTELAAESLPPLEHASPVPLLFDRDPWHEGRTRVVVFVDMHTEELNREQVTEYGLRIR